MKIIYRKLSDIRKLDGNPRKISPEQLEKLKKSLADNPDYFEARPIILSDRTGDLVIIAGNQRYEACRQLGIEQVPTALLSGLTEEREKEIIIRDNVNNGEWDRELLAKWDDSLLQDWGVELPEFKEVVKKEAKEDDFTEDDEKTAACRVKRGQIWQLGKHRLMCGDSTQETEIRELMNGERADLWLTDPPYNVDYHSADGKSIMNDSMDNSSFYKFLSDTYLAAEKNMKEGAAFYIWHADSEGYNFRAALNNTRLKLKQCLIWVKNSFVMGRQDYQWQHEPCLYGWKEGAAHYFTSDRTQSTVYEENIVEYSKMKKSELLKIITEMLSQEIQTTVIRENKPTRSSEHPTMKPVRLMGRCIINSTKEGQNVLDSFGGSGSTLIACEQLNRICYTMEMDPHYCDVIIARWEKFTNQKAKLWIR